MRKDHLPPEVLVAAITTYVRQRTGPARAPPLRTDGAAGLAGPPTTWNDQRRRGTLSRGAEGPPLPTLHQARCHLPRRCGGTTALRRALRACRARWRPQRPHGDGGRRRPQARGEIRASRRAPPVNSSPAAVNPSSGPPPYLHHIWPPGAALAWSATAAALAAGLGGPYGSATRFWRSRVTCYEHYPS